MRAVFEGVFVNADHVDDVADELAAFAPDVVIVDCMLFGALAGAYASGVPTAALIRVSGRFGGERTAGSGVIAGGWWGSGRVSADRDLRSL